MKPKRNKVMFSNAIDASLLAQIRAYSTKTGVSIAFLTNKLFNDFFNNKPDQLEDKNAETSTVLNITDNLIDDATTPKLGRPFSIDGAKREVFTCTLPASLIKKIKGHHKATGVRPSATVEAMYTDYFKEEDIR